MLDMKKVAIIIAIPVIILSIVIYKAIENKDENMLKHYNIKINDTYDNHIIKKHKLRIKGKNEKLMVIYYYNDEYDFNGYYQLYVEAYTKKDNIVKMHLNSSHTSLEDLQNTIEDLENDFNITNISE